MLCASKKPSVFCHQHTTATGGDDLVAVERIHAEVAHGTSEPPRKRTIRIARAQSLGRILDHAHVELTRRGEDTLHISHIAENMNDH